MTSHVFNEAKRAFAAKEISFTSDNFDAIPCMTNTTADTDYEANTVSDIGTLDEMDGSGFTWGHGNTGRKALSITVTEVAGAPGVGYAKIDATDLTWSTLGAGTRAVAGVLIVKKISGDATNVPICWAEFSSTYSADGSDLVITWHSDGVIKFGFG